MAYVPGCPIDVFISYCHYDNLDGLVKSLREKLAARLRVYLGDDVDVWLDDRIRPGVYFKDEIQDKLSRTPILVALISPSYVKSPFCMIHELEWFEKHGTQEVLPVERLPLEEDPDPVPGVHHLFLYCQGPTGMVRQLTGKELEKVYCDLAGTIKDKLREFWHRRPRVYVVQPDLDDDQAEDAWRDVRAKLRAAGYAVTPKGPLIGRTGDMVLRDELQQAQIAVRLTSLRESELAHRQVAIIEALGKTMVTGDPHTGQWIDGLLREVKELCERLRAPFLCLVCERYRDGHRAAQLQAALRGGTSLEVAVPQGSETDLLEKLRRAEAVLLLQADAPSEWYAGQVEVLERARATRERVIAEAHYLIRRPQGEVSLEVRMGRRREWIITRHGEPEVTDLRPFLDSVKAAATLTTGCAP